MDRAQEHLHYVTDIANEIIYILDQELPTLPQTPEDETALASPSSLHQKHANYSSGSSDNLENQSREGTPSSPSKRFFNRSVSGPGSGGNSDPEMSSRKCKFELELLTVFGAYINSGCLVGSQASQGSGGSAGSPRDSYASKEDLVGNGRFLEPAVNFKRYVSKVYAFVNAFG